MNFTLQRKKSFTAGDIIHEQFLILGKLDNKKHSSVILKGFDKISRNFVVVKITSAAYKEKNKVVTKILQKLRGGTGVPNIIWRGMEGPNTITVTECLGPNLKKLFLLMDKHFSVPTIAMIAVQVLNTLESIHSKDYVCCNIMPKEILITLHKKSLTLFITDYKQARKVKSARVLANDQISHAANKAILNKFSSVNLHLGLPASKKDDLESLGYIIAYFFRKGAIFDKNNKITTKEEKIKFYEQQKLAIMPETFCQGLPSEMGAYMNYIKSIQANQTVDKIDYDYLRKLFKNLFNKSYSQENFQYDWISKARTYNLKDGSDGGQDFSGGDKNVSEAGYKTELITFHSTSRFQESQVFSDIETMQSVHQQNEFDFYDIDEYKKIPHHPENLWIHKMNSFDDKVKTITHVKRSSLSITPHYNRELYDEEGKEEDSAVSDRSDKEEFYRGKMKSATALNKLSQFGKDYVSNKISKSN